MIIATVRDGATPPLPHSSEIHSAIEIARSRAVAWERALPKRQMQLAREFLRDSAATPGAALADVVAGLELLDVRSQSEQLAAKIKALRVENAAIEATMPALEAAERAAGLHRGHIADVADDFDKAEKARSAVIGARLTVNRNLDAIRTHYATQERLNREHPRAFQS